MAPSPISSLQQQQSDVSQSAQKNGNKDILSLSNLSFEDTFKFLIEDNLENNSGFGLELVDMRKWLKRVMTYNVPHGKHLRGRLVEMAYKGLVPDAPLEMVHLSRVLGWCVEILQATFLVADDIIDGGQLRRGQPCWHLVDNIGNGAVNDALMLEHVAYQILRKYFKALPCFSDLLDLCLGVTFKTIMGESLDIRTSCKEENAKDPFEGYTLPLYNSIVKYKTSYYTCYLPVALALSLSGRSRSKAPSLWDNVEKATVELGQLFQVQDDYIDCFGDEQQIGKVGMDIQEGKCTFLFVTAKNILQTTTNGTGDNLKRHKQYAILRDNYGKFGEDNVAAVKQLYREIELPKLVQDYQDEMCLSIKELMKQLELPGLEKVLSCFFEKIYQRTY